MQRMRRSFQKPYMFVRVGMLWCDGSLTSGATSSISSITPPASGARKKMLANMSVLPFLCASMRNRSSSDGFLAARTWNDRTTSVAASWSRVARKLMSKKNSGSLMLFSCKQGTRRPIMFRGNLLSSAAASITGVLPASFAFQCFVLMGTSKDPPVSWSCCTTFRRPLWSQVEMPPAMPRIATMCSGATPSEFGVPPSAPWCSSTATMSMKPLSAASWMGW
mmetsp:Transcript_93806/g.262461  ORF Transcript_93806/g.262461 Transcript_93806/m.262461 type:complete len:221 (+) Transcript_93806:286-948(+)